MRVLLLFFIIIAFFGGQRLWFLTPSLEIVTCNVGQGDAILLKHGEFRMLIDTGPNSAITRCLQANTFWARKKIDVVVLTHFDADHIGGLSHVRNFANIGEIWWNGYTAKDTQLARETIRLLEEWADAGVIVRQVRYGDSLVRPGWRVRVIWDGSMAQDNWPTAAPGEDENSLSVGLYIMGESFGFLSLGDLETREELALANSGLLSTVTVLKISHHGAKTASSPEFLQKTTPETALISVGHGNKYAHPDQNTIFNLVQQHITVLRTDLLGEIHIKLPDKAMWGRPDSAVR